MKPIAIELNGVVLFDNPVLEDERGWFMEAFNERVFHAALASFGLPEPGPFVQDNQSCSRKGALRGLHFQLPPVPQGKLVRVVRGAAFDVAVDVRRASPTFGHWCGAELSAANRRQLWVPPGFAHGLLALEDDTHVVYKCTAHHASDCERAIAWNDPAVGIEWPDTGSAPILSARDEAAPPLSQVRCYE